MLNKNLILRLLEDFTPTWTYGLINLIKRTLIRSIFNLNSMSASTIIKAIQNGLLLRIELTESYHKDNEKYSDDPLIYVKQFICLHQQELSKQNDVSNDNLDTE